MRMMEIAKKLCKKSNHPKHKMGCVIAYKNRIKGFGFNAIKTHPKCKTWGNYLHSEVHALIGLSDEETKGCTAYICRVKKDGTYGMARPCPVCYEALKLANIKRICYTNEDGIYVTENI